MAVTFGRPKFGLQILRTAPSDRVSPNDVVLLNLMEWGLLWGMFIHPSPLCICVIVFDRGKVWCFRDFSRFLEVFEPVIAIRDKRDMFDDVEFIEIIDDVRGNTINTV